MAITDENGGMTYNMPVTPAYGMGGGFGNNFGGDWAWIILLLLCFNGGWGGGFGGGYGAMMGMDYGLYPWLNNSQNINGGFRDQMLNTTVQGIQNSVTSGFGDVQLGIAGVNQNICQTGNGVVSAITGAQNAISSQMYSNQLADLERSFASQTATTQAINGVNMGLQNCCCENRAATADLKYTVATEACADRAAISDGIRDVIESNNRTSQAILDKLCALELDGVKGQLAAAQRENIGLQNQLNMATLRESQTAQNAFIQQGFSNEVDALYNRLSSCPVPTTPVYGRTPIFTCGVQNVGCGCGGVA